MAPQESKTVAVIGLGYVGLPLAVRSREKGYNVIGYDTNEEKNCPAQQRPESY